MWWFYNWVDTLCSQMLLIIIQMLAQTLLYSSQLKSVLLPQLSPSFGEISLGYCFLGAGSLLCVTTRVIAELNLWFFSLSRKMSSQCLSEAVAVTEKSDVYLTAPSADFCFSPGASVYLCLGCWAPWPLIRTLAWTWKILSYYLLRYVFLISRVLLNLLWASC